MGVGYDPQLESHTNSQSKMGVVYDPRRKSIEALVLSDAHTLRPTCPGVDFVPGGWTAGDTKPTFFTRCIELCLIQFFHYGV